VKALLVAGIFQAAEVLLMEVLDKNVPLWL